MIKNIIPVAIILTITIFCILGCQSSSKKAISTYPSIGSIDTIFKWYELDKNEKYLNLNSLKNGTDSFEMRLYFLNSLDNLIHLYSVKVNQNGLENKCYLSFINSDSLDFGEQKKYVSDFGLTHNFSFKNSDSSFFNILNKYQLDTLPTQGLIPNLPRSGCLDGATFIVEIGKKNSYRVLAYTNPNCYKNSIQNRIFDDFLNDFFELLNPADKLWYEKNEYLKTIINPRK